MKEMPSQISTLISETAHAMRLHGVHSVKFTTPGGCPIEMVLGPPAQTPRDWSAFVGADAAPVSTDPPQRFADGLTLEEQEELYASARR